jgi:8-amino-7-oxononanoate synthase
MSKTQITELFDAELQQLAADNLLRRLPPLSAHSATSISVGGRLCLLLCSNNYLGIADHPKMREAAAEAAKEDGCSASASRLVSGNIDLYAKLESALAEFTGKEDALVFSSGYAANAGIIQSVAGSGDVILSDELNHASIVDGCRLSKADKKVFRHNDLQDLEKHLKQCSAYRERLVVVEGVHSLDGDVAPLAEIVELARRYDCALMVDEAHAVGVLGEHGCGACEFHGVTDRVDIIMGTFGKALGSYGAFIAVSTQLKQLLVNKARSLIYTTALPPTVLAATLAALEVVRSEPWRRRDVLEKAAYVRDGLAQLGFDVGTSTMQIVPVIVGDAARAVRLSELLLEKGVFVPAIRPPSVPAGKSRLRVTVNAEHTYEQLDEALAAFTQAEKFLSKTRRGGSKTRRGEEGVRG